MTENYVVGKYIYEQITANAPISVRVNGVFPIVAPQGVKTPYILYQVAESRDVRGVGGQLFINVAEYQITLVYEADDNGTDLRTILEEIDNTFDVQFLNIVYDGILILGSHRTMQFEGNYPTDINDTKLMYASRYVIRSRRMGV